MICHLGQRGTQNTLVRFKVDTSAETNVLPMKFYGKLHARPSLKKTKTAYGGQKLLAVEKISMKCDNTDTEVVVDVDSPSILCLNSCEQLRLTERVESIDSETVLTNESMVEEFCDVFTGPGKFRGK